MLCAVALPLLKINVREDGGGGKRSPANAGNEKSPGGGTDAAAHFALDCGEDCAREVLIPFARRSLSFRSITTTQLAGASATPGG